MDNIIYILNDPYIAWVRNLLESHMSQCVTSRSTQFITPVSQYATRRTWTGVNAERTRWTNRFLTCTQILQRATLTYCTDSNFWDWRIRKRHNQVRKIEKFCQKCFSLLRSLVFAVKYTFTRRFTNGSLWIKIQWPDIYAEDTPHSTEYCRKILVIFSIFHCNWNIVGKFLSNIAKYSIATLKFQLSEIFLKTSIQYF